jgi:hypothetical protein
MPVLPETRRPVMSLKGQHASMARTHRHRRLIAAGAEQVASPVTTPWEDHNARVRAPDAMQPTLFSSPPDEPG